MSFCSVLEQYTGKLEDAHQTFPSHLEQEVTYALFLACCFIINFFLFHLLN